MFLKATRTWKRVLVVTFALWGTGLIVPEFARVVSDYGTLGFAANNDGVVTSVDGPPATDPMVDLHPGDCIDLHQTGLSDRLAVFGSMGGLTYVRPDREVTLYVASGSCDGVATRATKRVLKARNPPITAANRVALVATQLVGVFFIWMATVLVWQQPSPMTWGFFLYAIWFNPGQWFVSYAELERHWYWLIPQQGLQAVAQALGYAGFVTFALRFPHNRVEPRWRVVERMLPPLVGLLIVLQLLSFGTTAGFRTEAVSRWSYWVGYGIDIAVLFILRLRRKKQAPEDQQRTLWVHWGCRVGLIAFIFADSNMATNAWAPLWEQVCPSRVGALICGNGGPSETFLLMCFLLNGTVALAVFHAVRHHRVVDVRFALSRGATLFAASFTIAALLAAVSIPIEHFLHESFATKVFVYVPVIAALKMGFDQLHEWLKERCDRLFFKRLHVARERFERVEAKLIDSKTRDAVDAQLVAEVVAALGLASAAIFRLASDGLYHRAAQSIGWPEASPTMPFRASLLRKLRQKQEPIRLKQFDMRTSMPQGSPQPVIAMPVFDAGASGVIVLYGARTTGDNITDEEVHLLKTLSVAAGRAFERVEVLALRMKINELRANP